MKPLRHEYTLPRRLSDTWCWLYEQNFRSTIFFKCF